MNAMRANCSRFYRQFSTFGVVFDVDGVLLRGKTPIPGAREVLEELEATKIPFAIMTNGGGYPESKKARQIESILGGKVSIPAERVCMSHTPMRELALKHGDELVLVVGKDCDELHTVLANYGFNHVITVDQLHCHFPSMYPDIKVREPLAHNGRFDSQPFAAVFVLIDPIYWGRELQIIMDILCSPSGLFGLRAIDGDSNGERQHVPLYSACSDFQYVGEFHLPRYGAGAFHAMLEDLFTRTTGHKLVKTLYGKPQRSSFQFAETLIDRQHQNVARIYMIGDNPSTDICGANDAGGRWKSVLTLTGMHSGPANHEIHKAYQVVDDVAQALNFMKEDFAKMQMSE
ncbi:Predicted phosphatase [Plasmopara halstedii]|uniref:Predicted phosphatase n=1 Tax=Plasmopara halstedii TaxID=4781 RepID=A0A0P1AY74_PLAHL|nr:Predicted phosphatase [Plasmopara halstedii]CEG47245.1 Predicted phosphatase [Plasmopara halstedii]|eukprot:XP_024583614.1 Predicted phosphatase [Plasmopara halstedii]